MERDQGDPVMEAGARNGQGPHGEETKVLDRPSRQASGLEQGNNGLKLQGDSAISQTGY